MSTIEEARMPGQEVPVTILYTNYRGETAVRRITPIAREWFGSSEWHPEPQWLFTAFDMEKEAFRDFARAGVKAWGQAAVDAALAASTPASTIPPGVRSLLRTARSGLATYGAGAFEGTIAQIDAILAFDPATPAPAATPGVPDSVRALSEAASEDWHTNDATPYILGPQIDGEIDRFEVIARGPHGYAKRADDERKWQANRMFAVAAVNYVRTLLSTHPAGQSTGQGAETDALVDRFSAALKVKLRAAEAKYGWKNGWLKSDWQVECQNGLLRHVGKGDPLDVAAYAAFCWHHGWPSASRRSTDLVTGAVIPTAGAIAAYETRYPDGSLSETSDNTIEAWNRVAAAVCLAEKPAPDSTRTGQGEAPRSYHLEAMRLLQRLEMANVGGFYVCEADREEGEGIIAETLAALAARPAAPEAQGAWLPISTAPKDGSEILLTDGSTVCAGFWDDAVGCRRADAGWFEECDRAALINAKNLAATHWQSMPAPPASSGQEG